MGKLSRREFLKLTTGGFGSMFFGPFLGAESAVEYGSSAPAVGRLINLETGLPEGDPFSITGVDYYSPTHDYYYTAKAGAETVKIPMARVAIIGGYPWANTVTRPNLGIRLDETWATDWVRGCGASRIRVRAVETQIGVDESSFEQTIAAAKNAGLSTLAVLDTNHPWADDDLRALVSQLPPNTDIEALNEWDDRNAVRWQNQDPVTAAHFMAVVIDTIAKTHWRKGINTSVLIGSTLDAANITSLISALLAEKVPLYDSRIRLAAHFYPNLWDDPNLEGIKNGVWYMANEFQKLVGRYPKIDITEVGLAAPLLQKWHILRIIEACFGQPGVSNVYLHELVNHTEGNPLDVNFGLVDQSGFAAPTYYGLASLARRGFTSYGAPAVAPKKTPVPKNTAAPTKSPTPKPRTTRGDRD